MAYTKYSLTPANNNATPPDGAPEGMLPSAVNDTMRDMMAQIRDVGDGIRDGTYTMTAAKITGGTITGVAFTGNTFTSPVISGGSINNTTIGATTANTGAFTTLSSTGNVSFDGGSFVFNEAGADKDARFEGDTDANLLFLDASTDRIGIGTSSPGQKLDIASKVQINTSNSYGRINIARATDSGLTALYIQGADNAGTANELSLVNAGGGGAAINITGGDLRFYASSNTTERMRIDSSGNVGIGTSSPASKLHVQDGALEVNTSNANGAVVRINYNSSDSIRRIHALETGGGNARPLQIHAQDVRFRDDTTERMRITSGGELLVGKTAAGDATAGVQFSASGRGGFTRNGGDPLYVNRLGDDGTLVTFDQATVTEGSISVSGTTVSYNGGHLSRWAQTIAPKDDTLLKGTVLSNLDEMNEYVDAEGNPVDNEQLNKVKVSDVEGDVNVAGVFVNWSFDEQHNVDEINMAMTGDMIIRIAQGVVVQKGDLLMSAGDGTAKPQGDDIVRSKTIAKVTSNHVTCTYADGSYCVPCVLMAC